MSIDVKATRRRFAARRRMEREMHAAQVGGRFPDKAWPEKAAKPSPKVYDGRSVISVQDDRCVWHAAVTGPGLLCDEVRVDTRRDAGVGGHSGAWRHTLTWSNGTRLVDCRTCLRALGALESVA
jgi:hypothetical protein